MHPTENAPLLLQAGVDAAERVRLPLLAAFRSPDMSRGFKRDFHDIVTEHDRAAEEQITGVLLAAVPDSTVIGEEGGRHGDGQVHWHVDPIDGTANFFRGIAYWCVSIAAAVDGRVVAGVVLDPVRGDLFTADTTGAWLNGNPMRSRGASVEAEATLVSSFPGAKDLDRFGPDILSAQIPLLRRYQSVRSLGSTALNLAHVAAGWVDVTMGFSTCSWDVAAGALLVEAAGGTYVGLRDGRPAAPSFLAPDFFAVGAGGSCPAVAETVTTYSASTRRVDRAAS